MRLTYSILLVPGLLALYSSMSCILIPEFLASQTMEDAAVQETRKPETNHFVNISQKAFLETRDKKDPWAHRSPRYPRQETEGSDSYHWEHSLEIPLPEYTRGIYLSNSTARSKERMEYFLRKAETHGLNTLVLDVQNRMIPQEIIAMIKRANIFPVARVVVEEGGLKQKNFSEEHIQKILGLIRDSAAQGFQEVQLDYIRYADIDNLLGLSLSYKYRVIRSLLERAKQVANENHVFLSADLFGRVTLNRHDQIGQRLELFGSYTQTIYPMLYPSHYTNDNLRIAQPYKTVREGIEKSKERLPQNRVVAYIQGFNMKVSPSRLSFVDYIKAQIRACKDSAGDGWVIWNSRNDYHASFKAMERYAGEKENRALQSDI